MMSVTIDPSETRRTAPPAPRPSRGRLRLVLLSGLGVLGLTGFAALASSVLGGLAGPQFVRPTIKTAALTQTASDWPDLRDGIPALAPVRAASRGWEPAPASAVPAAPPALPAPVVERTPAPAIATATIPATRPEPKPPEAPVAQKPARLPPIENAAVLPPARPASLIPATRTAALVAPSPAETTRSRATGGTFAALPPEAEAPKRKAPAPAVQTPKPVAHVAKPAATKPATPKVASAAAPEPQAAEAEPEHTEVFGLKVPSLAPAGRKLAEGVEALGNAVKSLPDRF